MVGSGDIEKRLLTILSRRWNGKLSSFTYRLAVERICPSSFDYLQYTIVVVRYAFCCFFPPGGLFADKKVLLSTQ